MSVARNFGALLGLALAALLLLLAGIAATSQMAEDYHRRQKEEEEEEERAEALFRARHLPTASAREIHTAPGSLRVTDIAVAIQATGVPAARVAAAYRTHLYRFRMVVAYDDFQGNASGLNITPWPPKYFCVDENSEWGDNPWGDQGPGRPEWARCVQVLPRKRSRTPHLFARVDCRDAHGCS